MKWRDRIKFTLTLVGVIAFMALWSTWLNFPEVLPTFARNAIAVFFGIPLYLAIVAFGVLTVVLVVWIFWRGLTAPDETPQRPNTVICAAGTNNYSNARTVQRQAATRAWTSSAARSGRSRRHWRVPSVRLVYPFRMSALPDLRDAVGREAVAALLNVLPSEHAARVAFADGANTIRLIHLVPNRPKLVEGLRDAFLVGYRRMLNQAGQRFRP